VRGFMLKRNNDFITLNKAGLNIIAMGAIDKRAVVD